MRTVRDNSRTDLVVTNGQLVNVHTGEVYAANVTIRGSKILSVEERSVAPPDSVQIIDAEGAYLVPGLVDGHIHLERSKLSLSRFAEAVILHGTTSVVSGLDQIFAVAGLDGVRAFLDEAKSTPLKIFWGAPFKMPYTIPPSTLAYTFGPKEHKISQKWPECIGVWETVREFVLGGDKATVEAMQVAAWNHLPVFGCAPMATGSSLSQYVAAGIRADHESYSAPEVHEKLRNGMSVMIRESSVAHFLKENIKIITQNGIDPRRVGFCTDDVTATDIIRRGHLDELVRMTIREGVDPIKAIQMATINCAEIYRVDQLIGSITPGRLADVLLVDKPESFIVKKVIANGKVTAVNNRMIMEVHPPHRNRRLNHSFLVNKVKPSELTVKTRHSPRVNVLSMRISDDIPFVRKRRDVELDVINGVVEPDIEQDVLYVSVVERYGKTRHRPVAFISGFNLKEGAMASSSSPDDNNILCIGTNSEDMASAVNHIIRKQGGQVVVKDRKVEEFLSLQVGGIVADLAPEEMSKKETALDEAARSLGCRFSKPFMHMIFLSVTAIPDYAITDRGLVDYVALKVVNPVIGPA